MVDDTQMTTRANEAVLDILLRTGCYISSATMTEVAGTGDYSLDTGILLVKSWRFGSGSGYLRPERVSVAEIEDMRSNSLSPSGAVSYYAVDGGMLMVWPTPSANDTITVYYVPRPTPMSASGNDPSSSTYGGIPSEFHPAIEQYMLWKLASADDDETSGQGERYRIYYEGQDGNGGWILRIRKYSRAKGGPLPRAVVNAGRRRARYHDNSIWPQ